MNLLERVLTLLRANLNAVVEKSDDPEKTLRQLQLDMRNQLVQVKTQVATAISESRKLQGRAGEKRAEADSWYKKAEHAVQPAVVTREVCGGDRDPLDRLVALQRSPHPVVTDFRLPGPAPP